MNPFIPSVTVNGETFQPDPTFTTSAEAIAAVRTGCDRCDDHIGSNLEHFNVSFKTTDTYFDTSRFALALCRRNAAFSEDLTGAL
jgi:hypothetical protein